MKKFLAWIIGAVLLMIGCPGLTLAFAGWNAMGVCFILFFAINPLFSLIGGIFAGMDVRMMWSLPIITAVSFLAGVWIFFEFAEPMFLIYSAGYLAISAIAMLLTAWIKKTVKK